MMAYNDNIWRAVVAAVGYGSLTWKPSAHFVAELFRIGFFHLPNYFLPENGEGNEEEYKALKFDLSMMVHSLFFEGYYSQVLDDRTKKRFFEDEDIFGWFIFIT